MVEKTVSSSVSEMKIKVSVAEHLKNTRVVQLAALRIYHQKYIKAIDLELDGLLKKDVEGIDY